MKRLYLRPTGFVDHSYGIQGQASRLAGGAVWFSAYEAIFAEGGRRVASQLIPVERIDQAIEAMDADLADQAQAILANLLTHRPVMTIGGHILRFDRPRVMGILNMTPDSFSDGGAHIGDPDGATQAGLAMVAAGAAVIDVGGESTRPGAATVWEDDEIARTEPVVRQLAGSGAPVSIDTRKASVMAAALAAGAHVVNDVSALDHDPAAAALLAGHDCPVVLMHYQGSPETMQQDPRYEDALIDVYDWLAAHIARAEAAGIARERIIVDPGIGFGKNMRHNLQLLNGLALFHGLGCPILLGASRKRIIGALSDNAPADQRLGGSLALALHGAQAGAQILRVHDVPETVQALRVWQGLRDEGLMPPVDQRF
jgi:dihydropteroate synthase